MTISVMFRDKMLEKEYAEYLAELEQEKVQYMCTAKRTAVQRSIVIDK